MARQPLFLLAFKSEAGNPVLSHQEYDELSQHEFSFIAAGFGVVKIFMRSSKNEITTILVFKR